MSLTSRMYSERGRRRAQKLGLDPDRLPPGQSPTVKWPVLTAGATPRVSTEEWRLRVDGRVEAPLEIDWRGLMDLPQVEQTSDLHCVTRWSKFGVALRGVRARELLERARPLAGATHALVHCYGGYTTNLPLEALLDDDVLVAHSAEDRPLEREHGGPARLLVPSRYLWKSAKWVNRIEVLDHDEPGFWERNGYHNDGDPWTEERTHEDPFAFRALRRKARESA